MAIAINKIRTLTTCRFSFIGHNKVQVSTIIALLLLVLQNAASIIISTTQIQSCTTTEDKRFDPLTGILLSELLKVTISFVCITQTADPERNSLLSTLKIGHEEATLPALLYTAASFAQSIGTSHLDLVPYLALSQTKIILTPLLATLLLNQRFTPQHWTSTVTMTAGIILAQTGASQQTQHLTTASTNTHSLPGVLAMLLSGASVALGGISIERSLKRSATTATSATTFFVRNAQLAAHSLLFALLSFLWKWLSNCKTGTDVSSFFGGFSSLVWVFVVLQAAGGFLVAWCVGVTSSVTKNYAQGLGFAIAILGLLVVERRDVDVKVSVPLA
ncbi:putative nucleotide-sugar transporter [Aspergillus fischeri NRRL 181]|uniref:Nucleotide-sugar transporter, putative n=1 Tax=Neosartorya fischeri (strain ATCC 1020 / DSM 3700 / CBS 544.65 / FGSC A1164 / JCM 1740 / NRRL 181 / WB 181) TaxID=331117 RepID=A1D5K2_NEOFI|nr:nucleotide-sugar transporter, putative [Aspergillus fischeri NRRL 181]EAW22056.1 nucleotide-sugar transporter, putative [Aspergillus fischeri NRRL 181]